MAWGRIGLRAHKEEKKLRSILASILRLDFFGPTGYQYGWPSGGTSEPNVAAQWLFDEASGNIVDEVANITCTPTGTPNYNVDCSAYSTLMTPGVSLDALNEYWSKGADANLDFDLDDAVIEFVGSVSSTGTPALLYPFDFSVAADALKGYACYFYPAFSQVVFRLVSEAPSMSSLIFTVVSSVYVDDKFHKYRLAIDRSGNAELFIDGTSYGSASVTATNGENIKCKAVKILTREATGSYYWKGSMTELRITIGNATNNSGGPGNG